MKAHDEREHANHEEEEEEEEEEDCTCPFCGLADDTFDSDRLDQHYWSECPMLSQCKMCGQVIEISTLNEHLLVECEHRHNHRACGQCGEAVLVQFFDKHTSLKDCQPMPAPDRGSRYVSSTLIRSRVHSSNKSIQSFVSIVSSGFALYTTLLPRLLFIKYKTHTGYTHDIYRSPSRYGSWKRLSIDWGYV
jgi:hypothetical protein